MILCLGVWDFYELTRHDILGMKVLIIAQAKGLSTVGSRGQVEAVREF